MFISILLFIVGVAISLIGILTIKRKRIYFFNFTYLWPYYQFGKKRPAQEEQINKNPTTLAGFSYNKSDWVKLSWLNYGSQYLGRKAVVYGIILLLIGVGTISSSLIFINLEWFSRNLIFFRSSNSFF